MPVKWMYVLADGHVLVPTGGNKEDGLTFGGNGAVAPTRQNPIVGRVAFWTDDESTKINVNTATEAQHGMCPASSMAPRPGLPATSRRRMNTPATPGILRRRRSAPCSRRLASSSWSAPR